MGSDPATSTTTYPDPIIPPNYPVAGGLADRMPKLWNQTMPSYGDGTRGADNHIFVLLG